MIKFLPLGGSGEIGANCYYLEIAETGILLDCGLHPQKIGFEALPKFDLIKDKNVDYVLISHAHQDHLSGLPYLVQKHPYIKIITTPQTRALAELTLHNSVSILKEQLAEEDAMKIYSHEEIDLLIQSIGYKSYTEPFEIEGLKHKSDKPINAHFFDAGHILGSAGIYFEFNNHKIFYTGDINLKNQSLIKGAKLPETKIDTLILECTYGATESNKLLPWEKEIERFTKEMNKTINNGGSILIPVFALGKMQEILRIIWQQMESGRLAKVDIFTGGLGEKINRVYDYNRYVVNMIDPEFEIKTIPLKNLYEIERPDDFFKSPSIVLASSGMMLERTTSFKLAKYWLKKKDSAIFTVGYMDEQTPGFKIAGALTGEKIKLTDFSEEQIVNCRIENFRFSAHSKREDLIEIVRNLKPENVILVHGDLPAIDWVGAEILKNFKQTKVFAAKLGNEILLS